MTPDPRISVSAICTLRWSLDQDLAFWADEGIEHVGISAAKLEQAGWDDAVRRVAGAGLRVSNLIGPGPFRLDDPATWPEGRDRLRRHLDAAAAVGAACAVITTGRPGALTWEEAADRFAEVVGPVLDGAAVPLTVENTNSLRPDIGFLHTLRDAVDLARRLGIGVCAELNSCWMERGLGATIEGGLDAIRLVQLSDFVVGTHDTPNRAVPGDGDIPLGRILGQLLAAGYDGPFDLELVGPRIEEEGYPSAVRRSLAAVTALLAGVDA